MSGEGEVRVTYPVAVLYCGECSMPIEYCEYYPTYDKCREWLSEHLPDEFEKISVAAGGEEEGEEGDKKKRQTRGGRGVIKAKKKAVVERRITLSRASRGKKKYVTCIQGLATCEIDLKKAAKFFGTKLATGCSVTGEDELVIQGDVKDDIIDLILDQWPDIDEESIQDLGDIKR